MQITVTKRGNAGAAAPAINAEPKALQDEVVHESVPREHYTAETHTREQILAAKEHLDFALQAAKHDLQVVKRNAKVSGRYLPADRFEKKEKRVTRMARMSQILQRELRRAKHIGKSAAPTPRSIESHFMDVCREELTGQDMKELLEIATTRAQLAMQNTPKEVPQCSVI